MAQKIIAACGGSVKGLSIGVLGVSFKPNTDDVREAPSLVILPILQEYGASISAFDPAAMGHAAPLLPGVGWKDNAYAVAQGADALIILTEWNEFRALDIARIGEMMKTKRIVDLRNIYKIPDMEKHGFHYVSIGRPAVHPAPVKALRKAS